MMKTTFSIGDQSYMANLNQAVDLSLPVSTNGTKAWYVNPPEFKPVMTDRFTGSVALGGAVNFFNIAFNPHGHGTHTECVGHISKEKHSVNRHFNQWFLSALVITITPEVLAENYSQWVQKGDRVITKAALEKAIGDCRPEALIVRTLPNQADKLSIDYSSTNAPYFLTESIELINRLGIKHLLIDLPSVDRENDGGLLLAHHLFWNYPTNPDLQKTISELIYVPSHVQDGVYLLNLQVAPFENDAAPSRPVIFKATKQ